MSQIFTFRWRINNFSKISTTDDCSVKSPAFVIDQGKQKWHLEMFPYGNPENPDDVSCCICENVGLGTTLRHYMLQFINPMNQVFATRISAKKTFPGYIFEGYRMMKIKSLQTEMKKWSEDVLRVHCTLSVEKLNLEPIVDFRYRSDVGFNKNVFMWSVSEPDSSEWSQEKTFICNNTTSLEVKLCNRLNDIAIEIGNKSNVYSPFLNVTSKVSVLDTSNSTSICERDMHCFSGAKDSAAWKFPNFISKRALKDNCIKNGNFTLLLEFFTPNGVIVNETKNGNEYDFNPQIVSRQKNNTLIALQRDLDKMLQDKKHTDVSFEVDGHLFRAHKYVLCGRSDVFRAMFDSDMRESQTNIVKIIDMDPVTFGNLLKFMYTGTIDEGDCEQTINLMLGADKYQLESLIEKSTQILKNLMCAENICDILVIADFLNNGDLKVSALKLIKTELKDIILAKEWAEWSKEHVRLAFEITSMLAWQYIN